MEYSYLCPHCSCGIITRLGSALVRGTKLDFIDRCSHCGEFVRIVFKESGVIGLVAK